MFEIFRGSWDEKHNKITDDGQRSEYDPENTKKIEGIENFMNLFSKDIIDLIPDNLKSEHHNVLSAENISKAIEEIGGPNAINEDKKAEVLDFFQQRIKEIIGESVGVDNLELPA